MRRAEASEKSSLLVRAVFFARRLSLVSWRRSRHSRDDRYFWRSIPTWGFKRGDVADENTSFSASRRVVGLVLPLQHHQTLDSRLTGLARYYYPVITSSFFFPELGS